MNKNIKIVIFDLDGTLINAYEAIARSFNYVMRDFGYPLQKPSVIRRAVGRGDRNLLAPFVEQNNLDKALNLYRRRHACDLVKYSRLCRGAKEVLEWLRKQGYKIAVASNRPTRYSLILIRHFKLMKYFDYILCGDKLKRMKPYPDILKQIMKRLAVSSKETLYVGDMCIDASTGRRAKVKTVIVTTGSNSRDEIIKEKPDFIISKLADLAVKVLKKN